MHSDILFHRFPGESIVKQSGKLVAVPAEEIKEGFIFSNFEANACFVFEVDDNETNDFLHFKVEKPIVYTEDEYLTIANEFLHDIVQLKLDKAIFSRIKSCTFEGKNAFDLFDKLCLKYPDALIYLLSSEICGTWIGASPEVLLEAADGFLYTMALAGTRRPGEREDWGNKEIIEQELVADFITNQLKDLQVDSLESVGPYDFQAGPVNHLRTDISAELCNCSPWKVAQQLHPTPAVSGLPRTEAIKLIREKEIHDRGLYTGMLGFISENSARLFVNLRCAQLQSNTAYLYLGGGFTSGSVPQLEWQETENKSRTLMDVMESL